LAKKTFVFTFHSQPQSLLASPFLWFFISFGSLIDSDRNDS
jgi:hypothetical protein